MRKLLRADLAYIVTGYEDVPCGEVSVYKVSRLKVGHPSCHLSAVAEQQPGAVDRHSLPSSPAGEHGEA